jgi:hypothetical protein
MDENCISMFVQALHILDPMMMATSVGGIGHPMSNSGVVHLSTTLQHVATTDPAIPFQSRTMGIDERGHDDDDDDIGRSTVAEWGRWCGIADPPYHTQQHLFHSVCMMMVMGPPTGFYSPLRNVLVAEDYDSPFRIFARPIVINTVTVLARSQPHYLVAAAIMFNAALMYHLKAACSQMLGDRAFPLSDLLYSLAIAHLDTTAIQSNMCCRNDALLLHLAAWNNRAHLQFANYSAATRLQCLDSMRQLLTATENLSATFLLPDERCIFYLNVFYLEQLEGLAAAA